MDLSLIYCAPDVLRLRSSVRASARQIEFVVAVICCVVTMLMSGVVVVGARRVMAVSVVVELCHKRLTIVHGPDDRIV